MNFLEAEDAAESGTHTVGIRPEHVSVVAPSDGQLTGRVSVSEDIGSDTFLHIDIDIDIDKDELMTIRTQGGDPRQIGDTIGLALQAEQIKRFGVDGAALCEITDS